MVAGWRPALVQVNAEPGSGVAAPYAALQGWNRVPPPPKEALGPVLVVWVHDEVC